MWAAELIKIK